MLERAMLFKIRPQSTGNKHTENWQMGWHQTQKHPHDKGINRMKRDTYRTEKVRVSCASAGGNPEYIRNSTHLKPHQCNLRHGQMEAREMGHLQKVTLGSLQPPVTSAPGDLMLLSSVSHEGTYTHMYIASQRHAQAHDSKERPGEVAHTFNPHT